MIVLNLITHLGEIIMKKKLLSILVIVIVLGGIFISCGNNLRIRNNSNAKEIILDSGEWTVGKDIAEGRYVIIPENGGTNLIMFDENEELIPNSLEILDSTEKEGISQTTYDMKSGQSIKLEGTTKVKFIPETTKARGKLTAGDWEVGVDIAPGKYKISINKGSGNIIVLNKDKTKNIINEVLEKQNAGQSKSFECELKDGEIIELRGIENIVFTTI